MSTGKKKGLGRGLSALFGDQKNVEKPQESKQSNLISISDLSRNPYQPRQSFSEDKLDELANSIKKNGIIQPIAVRRSKIGDGKYEIIAGERRWLAAQRAGLHEIPVTVLDLSDVESLEVAIVENIQRDDLNPIEEARGYKRLNDEVYLIGRIFINKDNNFFVEGEKPIGFLFRDFPNQNVTSDLIEKILSTCCVFGFTMSFSNA